MSIIGIIAGILSVLVGVVYLFMQQPQFGKVPSGERLARIQQSLNYKNGQFRNLSPTPMLTEGSSYFSMMKEFVFGDRAGRVPSGSLPSRKVDLLQLDPAEDILVWFGHSSYFMQLEGKKILVDPVLSGSASPVKFTTRSFNGSDVYTTEDFPEIDYLFITHDHWDHLDFETMKVLKDRVMHVFAGLGVGAHLERWGYSTAKITESDWNEEILLGGGFRVNTAPARHFSGRGLQRNTSLWMSFILNTPTKKIYLGGDSGYDTHFKSIGEQFGPFDLVILENGQYDKSWKYIHMMPEEVVQAAVDLQAKMIFPGHWGKFSLSNHAWNEPIIRLTEEARKINLPVLHPLIGDKVILNEAVSNAGFWWENIQ
ncbi:MBL fold metallo-hydrolase [Adhaeribacter aquaticus]|uniref:MBL fold metallo-hydrolase n=1 Tax=Adhaeribacter aquaticus TaxID=299567 RepID=UPI0003F86B62|nr:MBL fold metallo-hydrolase [Adhaeribacter aquaticus]